MKLFHLSLIFVIFFINSELFGLEKSETFVVDYFDNKFKVISPLDISTETTLIINNKGLSRLIGKVQTNEGEVIKFFSINPRDFNAISLRKGFRKRIFLVPLSPAFQTFELVTGQKSYEIPPKK